MSRALFMTGKRRGRSPYLSVGADCVLYHAYWDGTAVDHSSGGNSGVLDVISSYPAFVPNDSLQFNNTAGKVVVANKANLQFASAGSCFAWIKTLQNADHTWICGKHYSNCYAFLYANAQRLEFIASASFTFSDDYIRTSGAWNLASICWGAANVDFYSNANFDETVPNANTPSDQTNDLWIGNDPSGAGTAPVMNLGEILLFNTRKSQADITAYFNATKGRYGL